MNCSIWKIICVCLLLLTLFVVSACGAKEDVELATYQLPFGAEEVEAVTVSNIWLEYKVIEDREGIEKLVSLMNGIECYPASSYNEEVDGPHPGSYGQEYLFQMQDGSQYLFSAVPLTEGNTLFTDDAGHAHKVRNFVPEEIWEQLDYEIRTKDPAGE